MTTRGEDHGECRARRQLTLGLERGERFVLSVETETELLRLLAELLTDAARRRLQAPLDGNGDHHEPDASK
jgi:hypothetical protein